MKWMPGQCVVGLARYMAGAAVALSLLLIGCSSDSAPPAAASYRPLALDVVELSAVEAARRMSAGELTSRALTQAYLDRIAAIDEAGPQLNAIIELNPQALEDAAERDAERAAGHIRGALHGLPVLIKDNIDVAGLVNSAGSLALANHRPARDAFVVARLRSAGAVILGKTNLSEWANFRSDQASSGWSSRGGQTRNAYVLDRNPCGSSSGTATAITASLAALGVGTETNGSILCPAAVSGLVGMKPTVGLISRDGIIPISASQDTAGPMARSVAELALLLTAMAGKDPDDLASAGAPDAHVDYVAALEAGTLQGKRVGLLRQAMGYQPAVDTATEAAVEALRAAGATVIDVEVPTWRRWNADAFTVLLYEFKDGINHYLAAAGAKPASLAELIEWNAAHASEVMPLFGQDTFEQAAAKGPLTDGEYLRARASARRLAGAEGLVATLDRNRLDLLVAPTTSPAWVTDHLLGDHFLGSGYAMAAVAGTPSLTLPMGQVRGLPLGLTLMTRSWSETELIGYAHALEQRLRARAAPQFLNSLP